MVEGATVEPGLRSALRSELVTALASRGASSGGDAVRATIVSGAHNPEATEPGAGRTAVWAGEITVRIEVPSRPGCRVDVSARRSWALPASAPEGVIEVRQQAVQQMAREVAQRAADSMLGEPSCRVRP